LNAIKYEAVKKGDTFENELFFVLKILIVEKKNLKFEQWRFSHDRKLPFLNAIHIVFRS